jgi:ABC-type multidrug transport system fused ATPase/permease subunit
VFGVAALGVGLPSSRTSPALVALMLSEAIDLTSFLNYAVKVAGWVGGCAGEGVLWAYVSGAWQGAARVLLLLQPRRTCVGSAQCGLLLPLPSRPLPSQVSALVESRFNAVERLLVYAQLAPEETPQAAARQPPAPPPPPGSRPGGGSGGQQQQQPPWPASGLLEFVGVTMSYRPDLEPVLRNVTFKVRRRRRALVTAQQREAPSTAQAARHLCPLNCMARQRLAITSNDHGAVSLILWPI